MKAKLIEFYLEYVNSSNTMQAMSDIHDIDIDAVVELLYIGKYLHECEVERLETIKK